MPEPPQPCQTCGRLPLATDPEAREALLRDIRRDVDGRFQIAEAWLRLSTSADRIAAVHFIDSLLAAPPLSQRGFERMRYLFQSLAADIESHIPEDHAQAPPEPGHVFDAPDQTPEDRIESVLKAIGWR